jgi:hypothetical protein
MGRRGYPPGFRRKVLDWSRSGGRSLRSPRRWGTSAQSISTWRRQDRIGNGLTPGLSSPEKQELTAARRRIAQLETELASPAGPPSCSSSKRPRSTVRGYPGDGHPGFPVQGAGGLPVRLFTPGGADHRGSGRSVTPGWPTPSASPMAADESTPSSPWSRHHGRRSRLGTADEAAPPAGRDRPPKFRRGLRPEATAADLVQRQFTRASCDQLWVTDSSEHPTCEASGPVRSCWTPARAGWSAPSIDATPTAAPGDQRPRDGDRLPQAGRGDADLL